MKVHKSEHGMVIEHLCRYFSSPHCPEDKSMKTDKAKNNMVHETDSVLKHLQCSF